MAQEQIQFEDAMLQLEDILAQLASPEITLDKSIELYAKAAELVQHCNQRLSEAEIRIREIGDKLEKDGDC